MMEPPSGTVCHALLIVRHGAASVPGFESLPLTPSTKYWPPVDCPRRLGSLDPTVPVGGGVVTAAVGADAAVAEPTAFVAVTSTRSVEPASAVTAVYCAEVAPTIAAHALPAASQRFHW